MIFVLPAEEEILKQYERDVLYSEEALCAALNTLATDDVICPICQKYVRMETAVLLVDVL